MFFHRPATLKRPGGEFPDAAGFASGYRGTT
jgi:hypothetical protein